MGDPNEKPEMTTSTSGGSVIVVEATVVVETTVVEVGATVGVVEGATVFETPAQAEAMSRTAGTTTRVARLAPEPYALPGTTPQRIRAQ